MNEWGHAILHQEKWKIKHWHDTENSRSDADYRLRLGTRKSIEKLRTRRAPLGFSNVSVEKPSGAVDTKWCEPFWFLGSSRSQVLMSAAFDANIYLEMMETIFKKWRTWIMHQKVSGITLSAILGAESKQKNSKRGPERWWPMPEWSEGWANYKY